MKADGPTLDDAVSLYEAGNFAASANLFATLREGASRDPDLMRLHGLSLVRQGEISSGLGLLASACAADPAAALAHMHHGIGLLLAGQPGRAAARFRRATTLAPDEPAGWTNFASALLALSQPKAARAAARRALALAPHDPAALRALGCGHAAIGDLAAASDALSEVVRVAPGYADAWIDLGLVFARHGAMDDATHCMQRAMALAPGNGAAVANEAAISILRGDYEQAIEQLRALLERDPACLAARLNLANALLLDSDAEGALALLEGPPPRGREGAHWQAHRALALLMVQRDAEAAQLLDAIPAPYGDAEILILSRRLNLADRAGQADVAEGLAGQVATLAEQEGASIYEHRVLAEFDLARHHARAGRRHDAFGHWQRGHSLLKRVQPFSREQHLAFIETAIETFDVGRLRTCATNLDAAPVFIVGLPRSGTTLCEHILAAHAQVHGCGERLALHRAITDVAGPPLQALTIRHLAELDSPALTILAQRFLADLHAEAPAATLLTDKMPGNALHLGFIATLLPRARIILCQRDPRDIGLSIFQLRFFGYHPYAHDLADLGWYIAEHTRLMEHWKQVLPGSLMEVALTDWVGDFSGTLARVLSFLDLPFDSACEAFHQSDRRVRTASAAQVRHPVNARGIGRWKAYAAELAPMLEELAQARLLDANPA
jgi:Flp pilus assembly protein TadD